MIEYITAHEADQQAAVKLPLGMGYQGRHPEAEHAAEDDDYEGGPFGAIAGLLSWPILTSIALVAFGVCVALLAAGVRL